MLKVLFFAFLLISASRATPSTTRRPSGTTAAPQENKVTCPEKINYFLQEGEFFIGDLTTPVSNLIRDDFSDTLYYTVPAVQPGVSLLGVCNDGRATFKVNAPPTHHTPSPPGYTPVVNAFSIQNSGSFLYVYLANANPSQNVVWNGYDSFSYTVTCKDTSGTVISTCSGWAFVTTTFTSASTHNAQVLNSDFSAGPYSDFVQCTGNCYTSSDLKWYARAVLPRIWDVMPDQAGVTPLPQVTVSGTTFKTDALTFKWTANYATVSTYGAIGNLGSRFPTMEEVTFTPTHYFTDSDYTGIVSVNSTGFQLGCLGNQNTDITKGNTAYDVVDCGTSGPNSYACVGGLHYRSNTGSSPSWYSKFGGRHQNCDLFNDGHTATCSFAPLLTPRISATSDYEYRGVWRVTITGCVVQWDGRFTWNALNRQTLSNGNRAWAVVPDPNANTYTLSTNVFNEAVQPNSWTDITRGFSWISTKYLLTIVLKQTVDYQFELGIDIFTVDLEQFNYFTSNGDYAFGYNMIVYPLRLNSGYPTNPSQTPNAQPAASYPDRRIRGFVWNSQYWTSPTCYPKETCLSSKAGSTTHYAETHSESPAQLVQDVTCVTTINSNDQFTADTMPVAQCRTASISPHVMLLKGPKTSSSSCSNAGVHPMVSILNIAGVSPQKPSSSSNPCDTTYQNITLRGVALDSHNVDLFQPPTQTGESFAFDGQIVLEFLLVNGEHPHFQINPRMYVYSISVSGGFAGTTYTCRTSPYWPVANPTDTNLPPYLCEEVDARTFGPTDWAVIFFDITDVDASLVTMKTLYITVDSLTVYFSSTYPSGATFWKNGYLYFNFRDIKTINPSLLVTPTVPEGGAAGPSKTDYGFAFTPGAHNENAKITIFCTLSIAKSAGTRRFGAAQSSGQEGENQLQQSIQINQFQSTSASVSVANSALLSSTSANGSVSSSASGNANSIVIGLAVACALLIVAVIGMAVFILKNTRTAAKRVSSNA